MMLILAELLFGKLITDCHVVLQVCSGKMRLLAFTQKKIQIFCLTCADSKSGFSPNVELH